MAPAFHLALALLRSCSLSPSHACALLPSTTTSNLASLNALTLMVIGAIAAKRARGNENPVQNRHAHTTRSTPTRSDHAMQGLA